MTDTELQQIFTTDDLICNSSVKWTKEKEAILYGMGVPGEAVVPFWKPLVDGLKIIFRLFEWGIVLVFVSLFVIIVFDL